MLSENVRNIWKTFVTAVVITTALSVVGIFAVHRIIDSRFANLNRLNVNLDSATGAGKPANFLIIGSDTRAFVESDQDRDQFVGGEDDIGQRSDTMMVVHVDPKLKKTTVMSIPRDTKVDIPGIGTQKINAAYNTDLGGGPDKVVETIQTNFDIPIHHYVEVDFSTFKEVVNALGTVNVYFPAPARDNNNGNNESGLDTNGQMGCLPLNGDQALSYVRSRHYEQFIDGQWQKDPTSNFGRIARQQEFMRRVASHAVQRSLADPIKGRDVADAVISKLTVDQNLSKTDVFKLMNAFNGVDPNDPNSVRFEMLPVQSERINGVWFDVVQWEEADPLLEQLRRFDSQSPDESSQTTLPRTSAVKVSVLNASGRTGLAAETMTELRAAGFAPGPTGNAAGLAETEINYTEASEEKAKLLATYIDARLVKVSAIADADVIVKLGRDFDGLNTSSGGSSTQNTVGTAQTPAVVAEPNEISGVDPTVECPI